MYICTIHTQFYPKSFIHTVWGSNQYTVCSNKEREFMLIMGRELKEITNNLRNIRTLVAMFLWETADERGQRHQRSMIENPAHEFTRMPEVRVLTMASCSQFKHEIPRSIFTVCGLWLAIIGKENWGKHPYFLHFSMGFPQIESLKCEQIHFNASFLWSLIVYPRKYRQNFTNCVY